ncbi:NAD(P)-dependent alcohol dehydrogenase [Microbacterium sp.]|uniref:NAD(P)-dependent alcohol dehydrogenase n=1 Tax=Microbacterium sp. TaxID=51671 RepID=UPI003A8BCA48
MSVAARAAVLPTPGEPFEIREIEVGEPRADEVLVRLVATGLCHTDLGVRFGGIPFPAPGVLGHEGAGVVVRVGDDITEVVPGDRVLLSFTSCGSCDGCATGHPAYCRTWLPRNIFDGARDDGTSALSQGGAPIGSHFFGQSSFAEYAVADRRSIVKVAGDADLTTLAPLGCGVQTGFGSVWNVLDLQPGQSLAVVGTGAVGLSAVLAAAQREAGILVAVDIVPERLDLARQLGATHALDGCADDLVAQLTEITAGAGLDAAFDTTGNPQVARTALDALGTRGIVAVCGAPPPGTEIPVDIQGILTGKRLVGVTMGDALPQTLVPELVRQHADGRLPLERLIATYRLDEIERAVHDMHAGVTVKPVIVFD